MRWKMPTRLSVDTSGSPPASTPRVCRVGGSRPSRWCHSCQCRKLGQGRDLGVNGKANLGSMLTEYVEHYNHHRAHQSALWAPETRPPYATWEYSCSSPPICSASAFCWPTEKGPLHGMCA
jgi:hypothetical protein